MADDREQSPSRAQRGPRPVAQLQEGLGLPAGYAVWRAPPAAPQPTPPNEGSLGQNESPRQAPAGRPRQVLSSNNGQAGRPGQTHGVHPPGPPMRPSRMSAIPPAGGISDSGSRAGQASEPFGRPADDLQSSDRYPAGTPVTEASRPPTRGTISSSGGAQRAGRTGDGYPEFPDDGRPLAQEDGRGAAGARERSALEAQAHAGHPADALFDLPAEPVVATPGSGRAFPEDDADKPKGPDLAELRTVIAAARRESEKFRAKARQRHDLVPAHLSDEEKKSLLEGQGRLAKTATLQTQKDYLARGQKLFERFNRETGSPVALEDLDPRLCRLAAQPEAGAFP